MKRSAINGLAIPRPGELLLALLLAGCANLSPSASAQDYSVLVEQHPELGTILTNPDGMTLYTVEGETVDDLVCVGPCLSEWRPYLVPTSNLVEPPELADLGGALTVVERQGNQLQLAYDGAPLYLWREDTRRGEATGNGREGRFFAANVRPTLRVYEHPTHGDILVGSNGMTLYTFARDQGNTVACEEGCTVNFPPLVVAGQPRVPAGLEGRIEVFERMPDDLHGPRIQVRYQGSPLYYFSRDRAPGDTFGQGIAGLWEVARP